MTAILERPARRRGAPVPPVPSRRKLRGRNGPHRAPIDDVAVDLAVAGRYTGALTTVEIRAATVECRRRGYSARETALRLGISQRHVNRLAHAGGAT